MRLKSFYAKTMTEAMQIIRDTLGDDAIIVATQEERGGVHVTAAVEPGFHKEDGTNFEVGATGIPAQKDSWLQYDDEEEESAIAEEITDAMLRHGVPEDVMDQIISCASVIGFNHPGDALVAAIEHLYSFQPLSHQTMSKAIMLVGAPGAGKTLAAAKITAKAVMNGMKAACITTDTIRAGGVEQLQAFTNLMNTPMHRAENAKDLARQLESLQDYDQIIIDTQGINPFEQSDIREIAKLLNAASITPLLVLQGGGDAEEAADIARVFNAVDVRHILPTRLDIARRLGGLLSAASAGGLIFTEASHNARVADGLNPLSPHSLSKRLMPKALSAENNEQDGDSGAHPLDSNSHSSDHRRVGNTRR